jgi:DNA gyrase inhibitor GyrI
MDISMGELNVQIINLEPMLAASVYAFGTNPEEKAWKKLAQWAEPKGFFDNINEHPIFGFNNPNPLSEGSKYGYELWMKVGPEIEPEEGVRIVEFNGGPYAVARCEALGEPEKNIPSAWQSLADWCKKIELRFGYHQPLEKFIAGSDDPQNLVLDLYCPIVD